MTNIINRAFVAKTRHCLYSFSAAVILLCSSVQFLWAVEPSVTLTDYYASVNNKSGDAIRTALYNKINAHTTVSYDNLKYLFKWTDTYDNAGVTIDDIYSFCDPAYTETWCSGTCGYNREHSVPKSWFNEVSPLYSDAFHLYPTNCYVNSFRGNEPFGECDGGSRCTTNGVNSRGRKGTCTFTDGGTSYASVGTVYEPDDQFKGDLARTYFYMVTCYMNNRFNYADGGVDMFTWNNSKADLSAYSVALLLKWHRQDPVSERELARNEVIYGNPALNPGAYSQGNRNPFIDYPELAEFIWGNKKGQPVVLAALVSGYDSDTLPPVPPTPGVKYGVNWSVNGGIVRTDSVMENGIVVELPEEPLSCSTESDMFMGWTDAPIDGTSDEAPAVLYTAATDIPVVTADITLYAVFAKQVISENAAPATYVYNEQNTEGWTNTAGKNNSYWLLVQGKYIESPAVDLSGLESITMNIRTYGGSANNTVSIKASGTEIATLTANNNKLNDYTWTNTGSLSGVTPLRFTAEAHASQGVGFASITISATGAGVSYTRYITACQTGTEIDRIAADGPARKVLIGGHVYILIGEQLYTIMGQKVQ